LHDTRAALRCTTLGRPEDAKTTAKQDGFDPILSLYNLVALAVREWNFYPSSHT